MKKKYMTNEDYESLEVPFKVKIVKEGLRSNIDIGVTAVGEIYEVDHSGKYFPFCRKSSFTTHPHKEFWLIGSWGKHDGGLYTSAEQIFADYVELIEDEKPKKAWKIVS